MNKKIQILTQKLKSLKKHQIIGLIIIIIGIGLLILPFIIVPLINTERIWRSSGTCMIPEGCGHRSVTIPENKFIRNKYDIIIKSSGYFVVLSGSIRFTHLITNLQFEFDYNLFNGAFTFTTSMSPGRYDISGDIDNVIMEIWEHGLIPRNFDGWVYLGFGLFSLVMIYGGVKVFQGFERDYEFIDY